MTGTQNGRRIVPVIGLIALIAALALGFIAVLLTQLKSEAERGREFRSRLDQSLETRVVTHRIFSALQDAETGERGFILTGDPEFLEPYFKAVGQLPGLLEQLLRLTAGTGRHSNALRLQELSRAELAVLAHAINTRQEVSPAAAVEIVKEKRGKQQMDQIRAVVNEILEAENREIQTYSAAVRDGSSRSEDVILGLGIAVGLLVLGAAAFAGWYIVRRRQAEQQLKEARRRAEAASSAKSDFLASMSHEIRTPLNSIIGYTDVLLDQELNPEQRKTAERIQFAGSALLTIVNDVLDFSKIEAGQIALQRQPFSLQALIDNAVSIVAEAAERKGLALKVHVDPDLPRALVGDEARIRQVLLNLLNNAVKFTQEGCVNLEVRCRSSDDCEMIRFAVSDTGIGIPQDRRKHLFHRFSQVDQTNTRKFGGTGLGLAISKQLVKIMGGEIGLESEEGKGSTFWFTLPLPRANERVLEHQPPAAVPEATARCGRILLVEDLEHNRELARTILVKAGHEVDVAKNGVEAVAAVQAKSYDLVLMDIQMPVMDGLTATGKIRALDHPESRIPIIAMTANVLPHQVKAFAEAGMNDHLGKPFKKTELLGKVNTWLARAGAEAHQASASEEGETTALDELREIMGSDWVASGLHRLKQQIEETFADETTALLDPEQLARRAHALVSHAALLGFVELSQLSSELEAACVDGGDIAAAFRKARTVARTAEDQASKQLAAAVA